MKQDRAAQDGRCARVAALTPETELPRRRAAGSSPALADLATPSGVWLGIWCKRECSTCVIHLCAQSRGSGLGTACAAAGRVSAAARTPVTVVQPLEWPACLGNRRIRWRGCYGCSPRVVLDGCVAQEAPATRTGGGARPSSWSGQWSAPPVSEIPRIDSVCYCEADKRVKAG